MWFKSKNTQKTDTWEKREREKKRKAWQLVIRTLLFLQKNKKINKNKRMSPQERKTRSGTLHILHYSAVSCPQQTSRAGSIG